MTQCKMPYVLSYDGPISWATKQGKINAKQRAEIQMQRDLDEWLNLLERETPRQ